VFLYATTSGKINVCDVREHSDFHKRPSLLLDCAPKLNGGKASVFNKWTSSVSDARFVADSQVVTRDYLSVKLWDLRQASSSAPQSVGGTGSKPVYSAQVADYFERNLAMLMEQDCLDDQFFLDVTPDGKHMATGGYNKSAHVMDINTTSNTVIACNFAAPRD
jgi:WD40 repeat protein